MEDNSFLMIVLAFVLGCMCSQMMKQMCGGRLVEGATFAGMLECMHDGCKNDDKSKDCAETYHIGYKSGLVDCQHCGKYPPTLRGSGIYMCR